MEKTELIHKVLSGQATDDERHDLSQWISADPKNEETFADIKELYEIASGLTGEHGPGFYDGLRRIQDRIASLKRRQIRLKTCKVMAVSVAISATIFLSVMAYSERHNTGNLAGVDTALVLRNNVSFNDATLESILRMLEKEHQLTFDIQTEGLLACKFTGTFYHGVSVEEIIRTLALSEDFRFKSTGSKTFELYGKGCVSS